MITMNRTFAFVALATAILFSGCASKKDLLNCQTENKDLQQKYQDTREQLATATANANN